MELGRVELIAECGTTANGDEDTALELVKAAKAAGMDAVKFMVIDPDNNMADRTQEYEYELPNGTKRKENMYDMFKKLHLSKETHRKVRNWCWDNDLGWFLTVDTIQGLDLAEELDCPRYKLSSWDCRNYPLIEALCHTRKPIQIDLGPHVLGEIVTMLDFMERRIDHNYITLMHNSHAKDNKLNLGAIRFLRRKFVYDVGWSSDTAELFCDLVALGAGASIIEKRLTLDFNYDGHHHRQALEPNEMTSWVNDIRGIEEAIGEEGVVPSLQDIVMKDLYFTSIVASKDIRTGDLIHPDDLCAKRPGRGVSPLYMDNFIGGTATRPIKKDEYIRTTDA